MPWSNYSNRKTSRLERFSAGGIRHKNFKLWLLGLITTTGFFALLGGAVIIFILFAIFARDLPSPYKLTQRDMVLSTKIMDRNGKILYDVYGEQNRTIVELDQVPQHLRDATVAIEDKDFFKHQGFEAKGMLRALYEIVVHRKLQGGSTLTQQLVKNALLTGERTITRKIKEFVLAIQVEKRYSKDDILKMYLNEVPYGGTAWGIGTAAEIYFGKKVSELSLIESAILAGLPQAPTAYSPFGADPKAYVSRTTGVLRRMREDGYITKQQEDEAKKELSNVKFAPQMGNLKAPHFVMYVKQQLVEQFGEKMVEQGGLQVTTSLDLDIQEMAQKAVKEEIEKLKSAKVGNGAAVVLDPKTGEILAMVGSKDYFAKDYDGNVNVTLSLRQPGSSTKPITYATAFRKGYTAATMLLDERTEFDGGENLPKYIPVNYDGKYRGPIQVRYALANSINITAVRMLAVAGLRDVMQQAYNMGLTTWEPTNENLANVGLSLTLGGREVRLLDLTNAFGVFANNGVKQEPVSILKVIDQKGKTLSEWQSTSGRKVLSEGISFIISDILSDDAARTMVFGPNSLLNISGKRVAVKTGTTDEKKDNWAVGYTPSVVVGVWVGNNDNTAMSPVIASGITGATPIWHRIMTEVLKNKPNEAFNRPSDIMTAEVDAVTGYQPGPFTDSRRMEVFIKGTEPMQPDDMHKKIDDKVVLQLYDPYTKIFCQSGGCPQSGFSTISGPEVPNVEIVNVADGANVPLEFDILVRVSAKNGVANVAFFWDGAQVAQTNREPYAYHVKLSDSSTGDHSLRVDAIDSNGNVGSKSLTLHVKKDF